MNVWPKLPLGDVCKIATGGTPARSKQEYFGGGVPWVKIGDMLQGVVVDTEETLTELGLKNSSAKIFPAGTVLISIFATIGRTAVLGIDASTNQAIAGLTPHDANLLLPSYLRYFLDSVVSDLEGKARGVAQVNINSSILKSIEIPLPPVGVQTGIVDILDRADALRRKRRAAIALLDDLAQSIFLDMFGNPVTNPRGWNCLPLTEACRAYSGGTPSKKKKEYWSGKLPWFSAKDLKAENLDDSIDHISELVPQESSLRLLPPDTVVVVVRGMILKHTFPVSVLRVPATINQDLKALFPVVDLEPQFLATCLRVQEPYILQQVSTAAHGTTRLDSEGLRKINILVPSCDLQKEFVSRVGEKDRLAQVYRASLGELDDLFGSLQQRAFRGELWND